LLKESSHSSPLEAIKAQIENHTQGNGTTSAGYGGILASPGAGNASAKSGGAGSTSVADQGSNPPEYKDLTTQTYTGQVFENTDGTCQVSVPGMAESINGQQELTHIIEVPNCNLQVNQPVEVTTTTPVQNYTQNPNQGGQIQVVPYTYPVYGGGTSSSSQTSNGGSTGSPIANSNGGGGDANSPSPDSGSQGGSNDQTSDPPAPPYFETVQLNAVNQGSGVVLSYDDTTGQTTQVTVTMENSEKTLFSGTFYSSQFHTEVNDVPDTPHMIDMTIQNSIYGTLHASVYAPSNIQNSTISGIFTN